MRGYIERRGKTRPTLSYFTHWIVIATFAIQLLLGAIAYGHLTGRVDSMEKNIDLLMTKLIAESKQ